MRADSDGTDLGRIAGQLKRVGVAVKATATFDSVNVLKKAELTLTDYMKAIRGSDTETHNILQSLYASDTIDLTGQFSNQQFASFKAQAVAVAIHYWHA